MNPLVPADDSDMSDVTDEQLIAELTARYTTEPVPPCRVCGAPVVVHAVEGQRVKYACSTITVSLLGGRGSREAYEHYRDSIFQRNSGDAWVMELLRRYEQTRSVVGSGFLPDLASEGT